MPDLYFLVNYVFAILDKHYQAMHKSLLKILALIASIGLANCSKDNESSKPECLPITITDLNNGITSITYDNNGRIKETVREDPSTSDNHRGVYTFNNAGKLTLVEKFINDTKVAYDEITYSDNQALINFYEKNGADFEKVSFHIVYFSKGKPTTKTYHEASNNFVTDDSTFVEYNSKGNVEKVTNYYKGSLATKFNITYDDKINPYNLIGYGIGSDEIFSLRSLTPNNSVKVDYESYSNGSLQTSGSTTATYTYDEKGYAKTINNRSIEYQCD
jgi:hypothetical protein